jgi:hypothetical protein
MSTETFDRASAPTPVSKRFAHKMWREVSRPVRRLSQRVTGRAVRPPVNPNELLLKFHPQHATVEPEGIPFLQRLVRESRKFPGPIIEIGTLLGITATHMALAKAPTQRIITVDLYCWNPWGLTPEVHEALASQVLHYLVQMGHVERICMDKDEFFRTYEGPPPAMVFLDAIHDYENTKRDIEWAQQVGAKMIAGHDYSHEHPGVIQIVDELGGPRELVASVWLL